MAKLFDNTFANDVVWQAGKWLTAYNVVDTGVDQFHHLAGQEPSLTGLVTVRYNGFCIFCSLVNICRRCEVFTLFQCFMRNSTQFFDVPDTKI